MTLKRVSGGRRWTLKDPEDNEQKEKDKWKIAGSHLLCKSRNL